MKKIIERIKRVFDTPKSLCRYFKVWKERSSLALGFMILAHSVVFLRWIDLSDYDARVFQAYLLAIIGIFAIHGIVRILMKLIWPTSEEYLEHHFREDFKTISPWQKLKLSTSIFFAFLFAVAFLTRTL